MPTRNELGVLRNLENVEHGVVGVDLECHGQVEVPRIGFLGVLDDSQVNGVVTDFDLVGQSNADEDLGEVAWSERNPRNRFAVRVGDLELPLAVRWIAIGVLLHRGRVLDQPPSC